MATTKKPAAKAAPKTDTVWVGIIFDGGEVSYGDVYTSLRDAEDGDTYNKIIELTVKVPDKGTVIKVSE